MRKIEWIVVGIAIVFIVLITVVITVNVTIKRQAEPAAPAVEPVAEEAAPAIEPEAAPAAEEPVAEEAAPAVESEAAPAAEEPLAEESSYTDELDPYGMYKVPEEWAADRGGLFVERETGIYTTGNLVPRYNLDIYDVGYSTNDDSTEDVMLYLYDAAGKVPDEIPTNTRDAILSSADFPILQVGKDEELHFYGGEKEFIEISKVDFVGYTIPACFYGMPASYAPVIDHVIYTDVARNNIGVFDADENPVDDVRNLEYSKEYKYEWYEGTSYNEVQYRANCSCYRVNYSETYKIPGELTKFGYIKFDISSLEPGFYTRGLHAVFEIVE